ncbi:MAG: glutamate--cysteine ligase [Nitrosomonas sp.]|nr:glutamate--cysteine ligase [Nitrosomonas sp.]
MPLPHLSTALHNPILDLENRFNTAKPQIEHRLRSKWFEYKIPFYCSVDLRNSDFNYLNTEFIPLCVQAAMTAIVRICPDAHSILLIPENHTRNIFYLQNIASLKTIMQHAGLDVRIGSLLPEIKTATTFDLPDGQSILLEPVIRKNNQLNRKRRNKMAVVKEGMSVTNVLVQKGVYTFKNINRTVAEPVIYMIDHFVVVGFYHLHTGRSVDENLSAPGMHFVLLPFELDCLLPDSSFRKNLMPLRFYAYSVVARLALLAAVLELQQTATDF